MALGVEMLLQSMGFDPSQVQGAFADAKKNLEQAFAHFNSRFDSMEAQLRVINAKLDQQVEIRKELAAANGRR